MNQVKVAPGEGLEWAADASDMEYDTEGSGSDSYDSEGEVPVVTTKVKESNISGKPPAGAVKAQSKVPAWSPTSAAVAAQGRKEGSFNRGWKPVIDGRIQTTSEVASLKAGQSNARATAIAKHTGSEKAPSLSIVLAPKKDGHESDTDVRVPEMSTKAAPSGATPSHPQGQSSGSRSRKRGGASADKEHKRLKRLLRNRVSAQQARERKKAYLTDLEVRSKELQQRNEELEERVSTLQRENYMLRQIVKNTALKKPANGVGAGP